MSKKLKLKILSIILFAFIFLLSGEVIIRLEGAIKGGRIWTSDKYLHVQHIPNVFYTNVAYYKEYVAKGKVNNWGFIGEDLHIEKPKGTQRIIVLGDSMTEAIQVDMNRNYCSRLEKLLNENYKRYEVINAGISDYSPKLEYLYLREKLIYFKPDYLILQLFANDVYDDNIHKGIDTESVDLPLRRSFVYNHSKLYHYFLRQKAKLIKKFFKQKASRSDTVMDRFFFIREGNDELKRNLWVNTEQYLLKIKEIADTKGIGLVVFTIPMEAQISLPENMSPASQFYFKEIPTDDFDNAVERFCKRNNVDFIDMPAVFRDNKKLNLYYSQDGHLTKTGHKLVAETIFERIR